LARPQKDLSVLPRSWKRKVLKLYQDGASDAEIKAILKVSNDLFARWMVDEAEFSETIKKGRIFSQAWWEKLGRENLFTKEFSSTLWFMNMKNRFGRDWRDRYEVQKDVGLKSRELEEKLESLTVEELRKLAYNDSQESDT